MSKKHKLVGTAIFGLVLFLWTQAWAGGFEGKMVFRNGQINLMQVEVPGLGNAQPTVQFAKKAVAIPFDTYRQVIKEVGEKGPGIRVETQVIWVKGSLFRTDSGEGSDKMAIIFNAKTQKLTTVNWKEKKAVVIDVGKMMNAVNSVAEQMGKTFGLDAKAMKQMMTGNASDEEDQFSLKATGKKKKINGFKCQLYVGTDRNGNPMQAWLATPTSDLSQMYKSIEEMSKAVQQAKKFKDKESLFYEKINKMPILKKWVTHNSDLHFEEFVSLKRQSVSPDLFKVPKGFKVVSLQDMFQKQMVNFQQFQKKNR